MNRARHAAVGRGSRGIHRARGHGRRDWRCRPKAMTVAVILGGLAPIMWSDGTGAEVMQRIAAPMIGGMITAPLLSMLVIPAAYYLLRRRKA